MGRHYEADVSLAPRQISRGPHALSNCNNEVTQKMRLSSGLGLPPMPNFPFVQGLYRYSRQLDEGLSLSPNQPKPPPSKRCVNSIAASKRLATAPWPLQEPLAEEPEKKKKSHGHLGNAPGKLRRTEFCIVFCGDGWWPRRGDDGTALHD